MAKLIEVECPLCHGNLWIDIEKKQVVEHKKSKKKNHSSLDELLLQEKSKKEKADERFLSARELAEAKKKKAQELFEKSFKE